MLDAAELETLDAFLVELNRASAEVILPLFRADHGLEDKGGPGAFDPVTAPDRGGEAAIRLDPLNYGGVPARDPGFERWQGWTSGIAICGTRSNGSRGSHPGRH